MSAAKLDVSCGWEFSNQFPKKHYCRNAVLDLSENLFLLGLSNVGSAQNCSFGKENRRVKDCEIAKLCEEDGIKIPFQKKKKISPIESLPVIVNPGHGSNRPMVDLTEYEEEEVKIPNASPENSVISSESEGQESNSSDVEDEPINPGAYGIVYKAKDKKTGEYAALKKVKLEGMRTEGFPVTALREVNILFSLHHPSIVNVKEVVTDELDNIYMVMDYMEYDLRGLMDSMRDLKTSNILLNDDGKLKICDFGLSRQYSNPLKSYTPLVVTLWYRAPEVLLGKGQYSTAIDMWSVGCIMAELLTKEPLFRGETEIDQLDKIFKILGTPNETIRPANFTFKRSKAKFIQQPFNMLRNKFAGTTFGGPPALGDLGLDLLNKFLIFDPKKRITAKDALRHDWFREFPPPNYDFKPALHVQRSRRNYL
ncbi:cyclin-dependent kinase G-2-like isoform X2 [Mercurialis annua]|uniref:cyclin-dependent kinase G-2-like isoform X2 n=1 Tax=Mercurialis annua TaxID=3986 RepID=UPI00215E2759|nr:cyclin-dependent kinase G-2-like isoform X2 [Mercurialis annua]